MSDAAPTPMVHVAVGILIDAATGAVLVSRRPDHVHQGGRWEFPGGKVELGETVLHALGRELREELGIELQTAEPLLQTCHTYAEKTVLLDVWRVIAYQGEPQGQEGQPLAWLQPASMSDSVFPAADAPIIARLQQETVQMTQQAS